MFLGFRVYVPMLQVSLVHLEGVRNSGACFLECGKLGEGLTVGYWIERSGREKDLSDLRINTRVHLQGDRCSTTCSCCL